MKKNRNQTKTFFSFISLFWLHTATRVLLRGVQHSAASCQAIERLAHDAVELLLSTPCGRAGPEACSSFLESP
jgi:hypothetical protein